MKLMQLAVPSALANEFKRLVAYGKPNAAGMRQARTTKQATHRTNKKTPRQQLTDYENAVDFLIAYLTKTNGTAPPAGFRREQSANLKAATFDPLYWVQCVQDSQAVFSNVPTSAPFTGGRAYAYPDPANLASIATYGGGTETGGALTYHGATVGGTFTDLGLTWQRTVYTLANTMQKGIAEPLFLKLTGSITGAGNARASRALLSVVIKRWMVTSSSARLTTNEPPTTEAIQALYRYVTPRGVSPFFYLQHALRLMYTMRSDKYEEAGGDLAKCVVLVAPMPLMGKRFNNNTSAQSTLTCALELWQVLKKHGLQLAGMSTSRIDRWQGYSHYGAAMPDGLKILRRTAAGDSAEITPPWVAGTLLMQIHPEGDKWVFLTGDPAGSGMYSRYELSKTDGTFSAAIDDYDSDYLDASNEWNAGRLLDTYRDTRANLQWLQQDGQWVELWELWHPLDTPIVNEQGVGFTHIWGDSQAPTFFFIPWDFVLDTSIGMVNCIVSVLPAASVPTETLWTNQGDTLDKQQGMNS